MQGSIVRDVAMREPDENVVPAPMTIDDLFSCFAPFVWRTLRHFGVTSVDLEDQTQEVFLIAHRRIRYWDGKHPRAWLLPSHAVARRPIAGAVIGVTKSPSRPCPRKSIRQTRPYARRSIS